MAQGAERLVGRTGEVGQIEDALAALAEGRPAVIELVGEPGIGKTRLLAELARARGRAWPDRALGLGLRARARPAVLGVRRRARRLRARPRAGAVSQDWQMTCAATSQPCCRACRPTPRRTASPATTSATGATAPSASCSSCSRERSRWCVLLDDLHWGDPASVELLGSLLNRPPAAPVLLAFAVRPRQMPERLPAAVERALRAGTASRLELGALSRDEAGELLGDALDAGRWRRSLHGQRRQPVLSPAARPHARSSRRGARPRARALTGRRAGSPDRGSGDRGGARPALGRGAPRARGGGRRGRSLRSRACGRGRRDGGFGGTRRTGRASAHRSGARDRCAAALPLPAPARPPLGLRGDAGRLAARSARAQRGGLADARRLGLCACPPRRARRAPRRPCGDRDAPRGRRCSRPARTRQRRALVRGGSAAAPPTRRLPRSGSSCC